MTELYRLAVVSGAAGKEAMVEHGGMLLPIDTLLDGKIGNSTGRPVDDLAPVLDHWSGWNAKIAAKVEAGKSLFLEKGIPVHSAKFASPLANPGKIVCIGSNFHDHIAEMAIPMTPSYPYSFLKPVNNTVRGNGDPVAVPRRSQMMDWEAELGVVIGKRCANVSAADALNMVAGYLNFNDLSCRDWLATRPPVGIDWVQHKAFDGFAPMGPFLVPAQFVTDPQNIPMRLTVNGITKQDSNTAQMVFGVAEIIEHLSSIMTLMPGDVIATGTPAGVGHGAKPPQYLKAGDIVELEIGSLGKLVTPIV
ncbi:fumarylacetoacetate hydrolase family protein [Sphingobium phenoxybenzoativorans]|uniref:Fumarylacetoacetate hydrolase family protein n=2 Tax=Sphingobium phenoxybenzoativorans TaxID=1592790 RepID=A0A975Q0G5_9SPHN|nr:fumarylacetoacetate hydrolase family protein [Sphingobium phenoxybenzoativorans]QUT04601.1 fumarylacetoacetate hydrolase family protein [Sphingobium phenoxybenzoativorans]